MEYELEPIPGAELLADSNVPFCPDCGTVLTGFIPQRQHDLALGDIERLEADIGNLSKQHLADLRAVENMKRRLEDESPNITGQDDAVFKAWCVATGRDPAKMKFGEGRQRAIKRARRAGYTQEQLLLAVELAGKFRYLVFGRWSATGSPSDRKDDLIDIFKDEKRIDSLLALAPKLEGDGA